MGTNIIIIGLFKQVSKVGVYDNQILSSSKLFMWPY